MFVVVQTNMQPWQGGRDLETRGKLKEKKKQRLQVYVTCKQVEKHMKQKCMTMMQIDANGPCTCSHI